MSFADAFKLPEQTEEEKQRFAKIDEERVIRAAKKAANKTKYRSKKNTTENNEVKEIKLNALNWCLENNALNCSIGSKVYFNLKRELSPVLEYCQGEAYKFIAQIQEKNVFVKFYDTKVVIEKY